MPQKPKALACVMVTVCLSAAATASADGQDAITALTDPETTETMISTSGFSVDFRQYPGLVFEGGQHDLALVAIPVGQGVFQIVLRLTLPPEAVEGMSPVAGSTEMLGSDGTCVTYSPAEVGNYEPQKVCSYQITLSDEQIHALAFGEAQVNEFFPAINVNDAIPAVGGREITNPIAVDTYNLNPEVNRTLWLNTAKVWLACWDANDMSIGADGDLTAFDVPGKSGLEELDACTKAKAATESAMGDIRVAVAVALRDAAVSAAEADRDVVARENAFIQSLLASAKEEN